MRTPTTKTFAAVTLLACCLPLAGCDLFGTSDEPQAELDPATIPQAPPSYQSVATAFNERVEGLDRFWARASVQVKGRDPDGNSYLEQGEGWLQLERPDRVSLSIGKLGDVFFELGSNETWYWWFDLTDDRVGFAGRVDLASPEKSARFGVPVHPHDLAQLLGITNLPIDDETGSTTWSRDGKLLGVTTAGRWGQRRLWLEPETLAPRRVELLNELGEPLVYATLFNDDFVDIEAMPTAKPRVASRVEIEVPELEAEIKLSLYGMKNKDIHPAVFDLARLVKLRKVDTVYAVDPEDELASGPANQ